MQIVGVQNESPHSKLEINEPISVLVFLDSHQTV